MYPIPSNETLVETKVCKHCQNFFPITDKDFEFYDKVSPTFGGKKYTIPTPTLCPDCRQQRRLSFRNERKLYKRKCDATEKDIVSIYSPDKSFKVYHQDYWWSDAWDPMDYGRDFYFKRGFFEQFGELLKDVPRLGLCNGNSCEDCDYTNQIYACKSCYLIFSCQNDENCVYGKRLIDSHDCIDCLLATRSSMCYQCIDISDCTNCFFSENLDGCHDMWYSDRCGGCEECILCSNLRNKKYYIENVGYSPKEYFQKKEEILSVGHSNLMEVYKNHKLKTIKKNLDILSTENVIGDYTKRSKDCYFVCDASDIENVKYGQFVKDVVDAQDLDYCCCQSDISFEISTGGVNMYGSAFSMDIWPNVQHSFYSDSCSTSSHLFACIGLRNKSYCILNKQYTREQYEILVPKIIEHMMTTKEWGEFFPSSLSPFGYNETVAQEYYPLDRNSVIPVQTGIQPNPDDGSPHSRGGQNEGMFLRGPIFNYSDYEPPFPKVEKIIPASKLPENIKDIPDDILNWAIECEVTRKPFRIIKQELEFYRKHNLPIPRRHPDQRHLDRMALRNPRKLFERKCDKCEKEMITTYAPERKEKVYCEECYNKEIL